MCEYGFLPIWRTSQSVPSRSLVRCCFPLYLLFVKRINAVGRFEWTEWMEKQKTLPGQGCMLIVAFITHSVCAARHFV